MAHARMRIGELAGTLETTTKTLRFYERIGLLDPPDRSPAGYRLYDDQAVGRARLVLSLRRIGLSIEEVDELLHADDDRSLRQRLMALMDDKLREVEIDLGVLQGRRDDLAARHEALLATPRSRPPDCVCEALRSACTCELCDTDTSSPGPVGSG